MAEDMLSELQDKLKIDEGQSKAIIKFGAGTEDGLAVLN